MAGNSTNVKLGICKILYKGVDLGFTIGGVNVAVTSTTHPVTVDQFGQTILNETITKREISVTVPLAETTIDNLVATMPGSTLRSNAVAATGTITVATVPVAADTLVVNGQVFTFAATQTSNTTIAIGATVGATAANIAATLSSSIISAVDLANYSVSGAVVTVAYDLNVPTQSGLAGGAVGNTFTLTKTVGAGLTLSAATLTGGVDATKKRVDVGTGVGINLLSIAGPLVLHPIANAETDTSEDLIVPLAATSGGMKFDYKVDVERVFNVVFNGFLNVATGTLYTFGDPLAA